MIKHLSLKAYGKINLGLDVLRRRDDGYHEVRMIMQTVGIYDRIDLIYKENSGGLQLRPISIICRIMRITWFTRQPNF